MNHCALRLGHLPVPLHPSQVPLIGSLFAFLTSSSLIHGKTLTVLIFPTVPLPKQSSQSCPRLSAASLKSMFWRLACPHLAHLYWTVWVSFRRESLVPRCTWIQALQTHLPARCSRAPSMPGGTLEKRDFLFLPQRLHRVSLNSALLSSRFSSSV